jgi:HlyD family secretion protein
MAAAEAEFTNLKVQLQSQLLTQRAGGGERPGGVPAGALQAEADTELAKNGLVADITQKISRLRADELKNRTEIEDKRLEISAEAAEAQLAVQRARVDRARAGWQLRKSQVDALKVRAGVEGVLQQVPVQVGQQVLPGSNLARVAEPGRLKAEIRIAETQARDVQIGQIASIDTRNGIIPGKVTRIDRPCRTGPSPSTSRWRGSSPEGARPDLSVDGTVELERLTSVLFVGRPAFGGEQSTLGLFRLEAGGAGARRGPGERWAAAP